MAVLCSGFGDEETFVDLFQQKHTRVDEKACRREWQMRVVPILNSLSFYDESVELIKEVTTLFNKEVKDKT